MPNVAVVGQVVSKEIGNKKRLSYFIYVDSVRAYCLAPLVTQLVNVNVNMLLHPISLLSMEWIVGL